MKVRISIRGRTYTVRSDEDGVDLPSVARYVDARMEEIAGRSSATSLDEYTVAMLACMNIASEFERYRRRVEAELGHLDRDLAAAEVVLRAAMPDGGAPSSDDETGSSGRTAVASAGEGT